METKINDYRNENPFAPIYDELKGIKGLLMKIIGQVGDTKTSDDNDLIGIEEAAIILKKSKSRVYALKCQGMLPFYKPKGSSRLFFSRKKLLEWIKSGEGKTLEELKNDSASYGILLKRERRKS
jgi:hypothetical protein